MQNGRKLFIIIQNYSSGSDTHTKILNWPILFPISDIVINRVNPICKIWGK